MLRGWFGEKKTALNMWLTLDAKVYQRYHNIIIPSKNGTTQIDHILVSPFGIFIVETKNMKGWIFGAENQSNWTQVLYKQKHSFQNPIRQTYRQKKTLAGYLGVDEADIHTVIFFVGDCTFKTAMPPNVIRSGLGSYIKEHSSHVLSSEEIDQIQDEMNKLAADPSLTRRKHLQSLHERHNSDTVCPRCGSNLVQRTARKGANTGRQFLGCENYPKCRFTRDV